jgi:23S rRNA (cytidine1920-2'-O)/16S rRNA (cytidine1409-2'-O)-methyltransferase
MTIYRMSAFVSRAGSKLDHALTAFKIDASAKICADLGCSTGGFTDCLLQRGAAKVFAVDTGYGVLEWKLRKDPRVVVMERTNAMHTQLPEPAEIITIDVGWTRQRHILPSARRLLAPGGIVVTLVKPHYEADSSMLRKGILPDESVDEILERVKLETVQAGWIWVDSVHSPIRGTGGNVEVLARLALAA